MIENVARAIKSAIEANVPNYIAAHDLDDTELRAIAIAAMTVQAEPQWQGIESAPRDGTWILVPDESMNGFGVTATRWDKGWVCYPRTGNTEVEGWWLHGGFYGAQKLITHWMPLPTPPAAGGSDAE